VVATLPLVLGYAPFALVIGTTIAQHRQPLAAWAGTWLIYGGSAHLAVLAMVGNEAGLAVAVAAGLLINTRLLVYAATLAPHWRGERARFRAVAAALLIDPSWSLGLDRYQRPGTPAQRRRYYLGAALTMWASWLCMVTTATVLGHRLAVPVDLTIVVPLCLLALVVPAMRTAGGRAAVGTAVVVALFTQAMPAGTGLLVTAAAGAGAGLFGDRGVRR
jgi:predicted branched-subunit amino acid permease